MLIASERHTAKDLELWSEHEAADLAHGQSSRMKEREQVAIHEIASFAAAGPCYCSISWGKDSVVVADLCRRARVRTFGHLIITATTSPNPDCHLVRDAFLRDEDNYVEAIGDIDCQHDFEKLCQATGASRYISGVRADESGVRRMSARHLGKTTPRTCRPIIWWTQEDVFGYLAAHGLPVHPSYAMLGGGRWERTHLRVSSLGGTRGSGRGRAEWEREYYGDVLRRMAV